MDENVTGEVELSKLSDDRSVHQSSDTSSTMGDSADSRSVADSTAVNSEPSNFQLPLDSRCFAHVD
jgi:hypothetical protein